jgi:hypothetical protein
MKTKMNISNLKKVAITACVALVMTTGSFTQLRAECYENEKVTSLVRLESFMNNTEQSIRYTAPDVPETEVVSAEVERLENLAEIIEISLKYTALAVDEAEATAPELERLEMLAVATEASLKYVAPAADGANAVSPELERLEILAVTAEASLKYKAPEVMEINSDTVESMLAENATNQLR